MINSHKTYLYLCVILANQLCHNCLALAWDQNKYASAINKGVHQKLTIVAEINSKLASCTGNETGCGYLEKLGYKDGLRTVFHWGVDQIATDWLQEGAEKEDAGELTNIVDTSTPDPRYYNHFHDPLLPWASAGLNSGLIGPNESALTWAQDSEEQSSNKWVEGGKDKDWSLPAVRGYFYKALTATDETTKQTNFAKLFRGLGHQLHLIQDMSVPNHVRNDAHVFESIEKWANRNAYILNCLFEDAGDSWCGTHGVGRVNIKDYYPSIKMNVLSAQNLSPAALFFDTDQIGLNGAPSTSLGIGLAEYTNKNFLSEDESFAGTSLISRNYAFPSIAGTDLAIKMAGGVPPEEFHDENDEVIYKVYIKKDREGETVNHLAGPLYMSKKLPTSSTVYQRTFSLDDTCYEDYAKLLLPRAAGYSAAFIDYFFRGEIELTPPDRFVLGIIDDADFFDPGTGARWLDANGFPVEQEFTQLRAKVRNVSEDEMGSGTIQLVARYLGRNDYSPDLLNDPPQITSVKTGNNFYPYSYSVSLPIWIPAMSKTSPTEHTFNFSNSPIPAGITDLDIFVVFKGTLGQEVDNAVAVGRIAEMNEPFHYSVENSTDYEIDSTGELYPRSGWSKDFQVCFNPYPGTCQPSSATTLAPGRYSKMILLYAGQALGVMYQDTLFSTTGYGGWISNLSRSKFLATDSNNTAQTIGFRGIYNHASYLSYNSLYSIDPYSIPAFTNPSDAGFLPFPAMPVHVNMTD